MGWQKRLKTSSPLQQRQSSLSRTIPLNVEVVAPCETGNNPTKTPREDSECAHSSVPDDKAECGKDDDDVEASSEDRTKLRELRSQTRAIKKKFHKPPVLHGDDLHVEFLNDDLTATPPTMLRPLNRPARELRRNKPDEGATQMITTLSGQSADLEVSEQQLQWLLDGVDHGNNGKMGLLGTAAISMRQQRGSKSEHKISDGNERPVVVVMLFCQLSVSPYGGSSRNYDADDVRVINRVTLKGHNSRANSKIVQRPIEGKEVVT